MAKLEDQSEERTAEPVGTPDPVDAASVNIFSAEFAACPQPTYANLREKCPVSRSAIGGGPILAKHEDVVWALRQPEIFSSKMDMQLAMGTERPMIPQQIDPPEQTRYRRILDPRFSRKRMLEIEDDVRKSARDLMDQFASDGSCDFGEAFAIPLPCTAFLHLMGLPQEDLGLFLHLKDSIIRPQEQEQEGMAVQQIRADAGRGIYEYFERAIDARAGQSKDDMLGFLMTAEIEGERLTREEILDISFLLLLAGLDTVTATLGCNITYLAENPEARRRLVENEGLIPGAIEELLRWETPVMVVPRVLTQDVTVSGVDLREGELVSLLLGSSNIDPSAFDDPELVDFERDRNIHVAFGAGPHRCLGSHLARMELRVAMEEWHRRIPDYEIQPGETPRFSPGIREARYLPLVWSV
ncbi:cytochrome P450 [Myxococcota bacterium]|nr:cytochrome P450 [Myxococcota bacterium]